MLALDNAKIRYSEEGYLPSYPPHLISDEELCEAFILNDVAYFYDMYPLLTDKVKPEYNVLVNALKFHICRYLSPVLGFKQDLPDWVISYIMGQVINIYSSKHDIHYFLVGIGADNMEDELTGESQIACLKKSNNYVSKLDKSVRFAYLDDILSKYDVDEQDQINKLFDKWGVTFDGDGRIVIRPASMFGEHNVIKLIRVSEVR